MADTDLSHLSADERRSLLEEAEAEIAAANKMKNPANAPGLPPPITGAQMLGGYTGAVHRKRTKDNTFLTEPDPEVQDLIKQRGGEGPVNAWRSANFAPQSQEAVNSGRNDQQSAINPSEAPITEQLVGNLAGVLPGPQWARILNSLTTKTPADLATLGILHNGGALLDKVKAGTSPGLNAALGAVKGAGMYEGGNRINAALSGQEQPQLNPLNRNYVDNGLGALSGVLGGAAGYKSVPTPLDKNSIAASAYAEYQQRIKAAEIAHNDLSLSADTAKAEHKKNEVALSKLETGASEEAKAVASGNVSVATDALLKKQQETTTLRTKLEQELAVLQQNAQAVSPKTPGLRANAALQISRKQAELRAFDENAKNELASLSVAKTSSGKVPSTLDTSRGKEIADARAAGERLYQDHLKQEAARRESDAALKDLKLNTPDKPDSKVSPATILGKKLLPYLLPGLGAGYEAHSTGTLFGMGTPLGAAAGYGMQKALTSDTAAKLRALAGKHVTPNAMLTIPALVNGRRSIPADIDERLRALLPQTGN